MGRVVLGYIGKSEYVGEGEECEKERDVVVGYVAIHFVGLVHASINSQASLTLLFEKTMGTARYIISCEFDVINKLQIISGNKCK